MKIDSVNRLFRNVVRQLPVCLLAGLIALSGLAEIHARESTGPFSEIPIANMPSAASVDEVHTSQEVFHLGEERPPLGAALGYPGTDLAIREIILPDSIVRGLGSSVRCVVENRGPEYLTTGTNYSSGARYATHLLFLSADSLFEPSEAAMTLTGIINLPAGGLDTLDFYFTVDTLAADSLFFLVVLDRDDITDDMDRTNNQNTAFRAVPVVSPARPDLALVDYLIPDSIPAGTGTAAIFDFVVQNLGPVTCNRPGTFVIRLFGNNGDTLFTSIQNVYFSLGPGLIDTIRVSPIIPCIWAESCVVATSIDLTPGFWEVNKANNSISSNSFGPVSAHEFDINTVEIIAPQSDYFDPSSWQPISLVLENSGNEQFPANSRLRVDFQWYCLDSMIRSDNRVVALNPTSPFGQGATDTIGPLFFLYPSYVPDSLLTLRSLVNVDNSFCEANIANNAAEKTFRTVRKFADIVAEEVLLPSIITSGVPFQMGLIMSNVGDTGMGNSNNDLSVVLKRNDTIVQRFSNSYYGNIPPLITDTAYFTITIPRGLSGSYLMEVSFSGSFNYGVLEKDTSNNTASTIVNVSTQRLPDLQIVSMVCDSIAIRTDSLLVSWVVKNIGDTSLNASSVTDMISIKAAHGSTVTEVNRPWSTTERVLPAGDSVFRQAWIAVPITTPENAGIAVMVDNQQRIVEKDETNNIWARALRQVITPPLPDLIVREILVPDTVLVRDTVRARFIVENIGTDTLKGNRWDFIQLLRPQSQSYYYATRVVSNRTLPPGGQDTVAINLLFTIDLDTIGIVQVTTNSPTSSNLLLPESNSSNNMLRDTTRLALPPRPDLRVTWIQALDSVMPGDSFMVTYAVENIGDATASWTTSNRDGIWLSFNQRDEQFLSYSAVPSGSLQANSVDTVSQMCLMPSTVPSAMCTLRVIADANDRIWESSNNNNESSATIAASGRFDLSIDSMTVAESLPFVPGSYFSFTVHIKNNGDRPVRSIYRGSLEDLQFYLYSGDDSSTVFLHTRYEYRNTSQFDLSVGEEDSFEIGATVEPTDSLPQFFGIRMVHPFDQDSSNNKIISNVRTTFTHPKIPQLKPNDIITPYSVFKNDTLRFSWILENSGDTVVSTTQLACELQYSSDWRLGDELPLMTQYLQNMSLQPGEQDTIESWVKLPTYAIDSFWVVVKIGGFGNNRTISVNPVYSLTPSRADLRLVSVILPDSASKADSAHFGVVIENIGDSLAAPPWHEAVGYDWDFNGYYSYDIKEHLEALPAGVTDTVWFSKFIPENAPDSISIAAFTDYNNRIWETDESNNTSLSPLKLRVFTPPHADLRIDTIISPTVCYTGAPFQVSWRLTNRGTSTAYGPWTDRVSASTDTILGSSDLLLGDFQFLDSIRPGESVLRTQTVQFARGISGSFHLFVTADRNNNVLEFQGNANNSQYVLRAVPVIESPFADLLVDSVISQESVDAGGQIAVRWYVSNRGNGATDAPLWYDHAYLSRDQLLSSNDTYLGALRNPQYLPVGISYRQEGTFSVPWELLGDYYVIVRTDAQRHLTELTGDNNNDRSSPGRVLVNFKSQPKADLAVVEFQTDTAGYVGTDVSVNYRITNIGDIDASGGIHYADVLFLSPDSNRTPLQGDINLGFVRDRWSPFLAKDSSFVERDRITLPDVPTGTYYLYLWTNPAGLLPEKDLGNNFSRLSRIEITGKPPADLEVTALSVSPDSQLASHEFILRYTVTNLGIAATLRGSWRDDFWMSRDTFVDPAADVYIDSAVFQGRLLSGDSANFYDVTRQLRIPDTLDGTWQLIVCTDAADQVEEGQWETNNCAAHTRLAVTLAPPDLQLTEMYIVDSAFSSQLVRFAWKTQNNGVGPTPEVAWSEQFFLSSDSILSPDDTLLARKSNETYLASGSYYSSWTERKVPDGLSGTFYLIGLTDYDNSVFEGQFEDNNRRILPFTIRLSPPCDLRITRMDFPDSLPVGSQLPIELTVVNSGVGATIGGAWADALFLSEDTLLDTLQDQRIGVLTRQSALQRLASYNVSLNLKMPYLAPSNYYVLGVTDLYDGIYEHQAEQNNITSVSITLEPNFDLPDLIIDSLLSDSLAHSGDSITVQWVVRNQSLKEANGRRTPWRDNLFLSRDTILDSLSDIRLTSRIVDQQLASHTDYRTVVRVRAPLVETGEYFLLVTTDAQDSLKETFEDNNVASKGFTIELLFADLFASDVEAPDTAFAGQQMDVHWVVRNQGQGISSTSEWNDVVYLSRDRIADPTDYEIGSLHHSGYIETDSGYTSSLTASIPYWYTGEAFVIVGIDAGKLIKQSHYANDWASTNTETWISPPAPIDLSAIAIESTDSSLSGDSVLVEWSVGVSGDLQGRAKWADAVYISLDTILGIEDELIGIADITQSSVSNGKYLNRLSMNASDVANVLQTITPGVIPSNYFVLVSVDCRNGIFETDEENNSNYGMSQISLNVFPIEFGAMIEGSVTSGSPRYYRLLVPDSVVAEVNAATKVDGQEVTILLGNGFVPSTLQYDQMKTITSSPGNLFNFESSGDVILYITVLGPSSTPFDFTLSVSPARMKLLSCAPNPIGNSQRVTLEIHGSGLNPSDRYILCNRDSAFIAFETIRLHQTSVAATFDLRTAKPGTYALIVTRDQVRLMGDSVKDMGMLDTMALLSDTTLLLTTRSFEACDKPLSVEIVPADTDSLLEGKVELAYSSAWRRGQSLMIEITYTNNSVSDLPVPILALTFSNEVNLTDPGGGYKRSVNKIWFHRIVERGNQNYLRPGESFTSIFDVEVPLGVTSLQFNCAAVNIADWNPDWETLLQTLQAEFGDSMWTRVVQELDSSFGDSWSEFEAGVLQYHVANARSLGSYVDVISLMRHFAQNVAADSFQGNIVQTATQQETTDRGLEGERAIGHSNYVAKAGSMSEPCRQDLADATEAAFWNLLLDKSIDRAILEAALRDAKTKDEFIRAVAGLLPGIGDVLDAEQAVEALGNMVLASLAKINLEHDVEMADALRDYIGTSNTQGPNCTGLGPCLPRVMPSDARILSTLRLSRTFREFDNEVYDDEMIPFAENYVREHFSPADKGKWKNIDNFYLLLEFPQVQRGRQVTLFEYDWMASNSSYDIALRDAQKVLPFLTLGYYGPRSIEYRIVSTEDAPPVCVSTKSLPKEGTVKPAKVEFRLKSNYRWSGRFDASVPTLKGNEMVQYLEKCGWAQPLVFLHDYDGEHTWTNDQLLVVDESDTRGNPPCDDPNWPPCPPYCPCERPPCQGGQNGSSTEAGSYDPNLMVGPAGVDGDNGVVPSQALPYVIYFENLAEATAPAQRVIVADTLPVNLDWRRFRLTDIRFGPIDVEVPDNVAVFAKRVPYDTLGHLVDIRAGIDVATGVATWTFTTLDPRTGLIPEDPLAGFLPPNDSTHRGEGFVGYTIKAKPGLTSGAEIRNSAAIVFDDNPAIVTNEVVNLLIDPLTDLQIAGFSLSPDQGAIEVGDSARITVSVFADGGRVPNDVVVNAYFERRDSVIMVGSDTLVNLYPGQSRQMNLVWIPSMVTDSAIIRLVLDPFGDISEYDETNNQTSVPVRVRPAAAIAGTVLDEAGNPVSGATVHVFDQFPTGVVIDSAITDEQGWYSFFSLSSDSADLWVFKQNYYPQRIENAAQRGGFERITLLGTIGPLATLLSFNAYCDSAYYLDAPMPVGSVIEVTAPSGQVVGTHFVHQRGQFGLMSVYLNADSSGNRFSFWVNGYRAKVGNEYFYETSQGGSQRICLSVGDEVTKVCNLESGWNLVSWPVNTESDAIERVLGPYRNCIDLVLGFQNGGLTWDPQLPQFSTLSQADHLNGYWIKVKPSCGVTLQMTGQEVPSNTALPIRAGWNLVPYLYPDALPPSTGLASLRDHVNLAYGFDRGAKLYDPDLPQFNTLTLMEPCLGYWISADSAGTLVYGTASQPVTTFPMNKPTPTGRFDGVMSIRPEWMLLYGGELTLDGKRVKDGALFQAWSQAGQEIGRGIVRAEGVLPFMNVYGSSEEAVATLPNRGETFTLSIDGKKVSQSFTWTEFGDKLMLGGLTSSQSLLPKDYSLSQNYPNPFNPLTTISFALPKGGKTKLTIYNVLGQIVETLLDDWRDAGNYKIVWSGNSRSGNQAASGVYFYRLESGDFRQTKKMMLLK